MLEVDETFTTIWLSRSSEVRVKVRRWAQSPIWTIFYSLDIFSGVNVAHCRLVAAITVATAVPNLYFCLFHCEIVVFTRTTELCWSCSVQHSGGGGWN